MKTALNLVNLLGDTLYLLGPVKAYLAKRPDEFLGLVVDDSMSGQLVKAQFPDETYWVSDEQVMETYPEAVVLKLSAGQSGSICFRYAQEPGGRQLHISEGYAAMLGVDLPIDIVPPTDWQKKIHLEKEYALIAPFSRSCSRHTTGIPNKTLDDAVWMHIIRFLQKHDFDVKVIGGPTDRFKSAALPVTSYLSAATLEEMETILAKAQVLITIDNGICHIASSLGVKTILLWPQVSCREFIAPVWAADTAICYIGDPVNATAAALLTAIRTFTQMLIARDAVENTSRESSSA